MKLYEIAEQYKNVAELLQNSEFAEEQDVIAALDCIEDDFNHKVEQTVYIMKNIESEIHPIDAEIKRLSAMKKVRQNNIDRIKERLKLNMKETGINLVNCSLFKVSYRETENNVVELDENLFLANNLNENFVTVKITPNKTAIKTALEQGENVIGAKLVNSQVLTIR
ncbi:MAG: siphovirus Gp157 family protein [[Pasteurella] mairii]|uniref:Siphovirus Gp157 n=1 Tax=[Pasteurella] mairii TaxID=757 RepID=A0A379B4C8_9PAST|nr:siphovirus Gp157 family protein [[Pasteurella] mairii]SUB28763.1 Siphovirus Gp157 [[Pasteurella] mairii]SUB33366.1 Siphovirus Gp157 [[Pasteurella] mairii]